MTHLDLEIKQLKAATVEMFELVNSQMKKSFDALIKTDTELAHEVNFNEKRVNALELKIDKDLYQLDWITYPVQLIAKNPALHHYVILRDNYLNRKQKKNKQVFHL